LQKKQASHAVSEKQQFLNKLLGETETPDIHSYSAQLEKKKLIRCKKKEDGLSFRVPGEVQDSLRKNNTYTPEEYGNLSIFGFFSVLRRIFVERIDKELTYNSLKTELLNLVNQNKHLNFCKKIMSYCLDENDLILLLRFCDLYGAFDMDIIQKHNLEFMFDKELDFSGIMQLLFDGSHPLMKAKLIEHTNEDNSFVCSDVWKLSDTAKKELMTELKEKKYKKNLILYNSIKPKKMYYNERETEEIQKLVSLLQNKNYRKIQTRLGNKGFRKGFACLFSGGPGTGKTETVYQIARQTKRNIMMVDISEVKSKWFGESEKKIKEIFDTYRTAVENSKVTPILLFNEADAVIGKRKEFNSFSRAVDQTENTIQNIILQELENLSGILIATTNLVQNMDNAFERRFLYKIKFDKPGLESRVGIWNALLPALPDETARELSLRFELTGGQIENIARKTEVDDIIHGNSLSMDTLVKYCKAETVKENANKRVGFIS